MDIATAQASAASGSRDMRRKLPEDDETVARACRNAARICRDADTVTEDVMNQRLRAHEKAAWVLRASLQPWARRTTGPAAARR